LQEEKRNKMAKNKVMGKISSKTIGKKVDTVADYIDIVSQMIAEYFNQRYKIKKKVEDIKNGILDSLYQFKSSVFRSILEIFFLLTGITALLIGLAIFLSRFVALDILLIAYGLVVSFGVLVTAKLRRS